MAAESPVRMYSVDDHRTPRRLADKLTAMRREKLDSLPLAQSWDDFKRRTGHIAGLDDAIAVCAEIDEELSGKHRS